MSDTGARRRPLAVIPAAQRATSEAYRFSAAISTNDLLLCSGQLGRSPDGVLSADPAEQFEQAFANVAEVLAEAGCTWADVVEMTTFHVALSDHLATFAGVRARWVQEPWPAWTAIGISELAAPGALVEVKVVAAIP